VNFAQVQKVLMKLAEEGALEGAHIQLIWSLTEKVRMGTGQLHASRTSTIAKILLSLKSSSSRNLAAPLATLG
jgi:hypothetical protein